MGSEVARLVYARICVINRVSLAPERCEDSSDRPRRPLGFDLIVVEVAAAAFQSDTHDDMGRAARGAAERATLPRQTDTC